VFDGELSDKDQVVARANNNVQLLQTDNANPTRAGTWKVLAPAAPGAFNDITVTNSHFTNIGTNGIESYGQWNVFNTSFQSIAGNGIMSDSGVTTVSGNTFTNIGGSDMYSNGGSFVISTP
jgi:hypothetical protein